MISKIFTSDTEERMESVNYEYLIQRMIIQKNSGNATKHRSFNVSRGDFSKYAILNGFYGKKLISTDARKFYSSMWNGKKGKRVLCNFR